MLERGLLLRPAVRCGGLTAGVLAAAMVLSGGSGVAWSERQPHAPHRPHAPRKPRDPNQPPPPPAGGAGQDGGGATLPAPLVESQWAKLPGRGTHLAWAPDGHAIAVGGHFIEPETGLRYDTRVYDVASNTLARSYACHYYWTVSAAWAQNPWLGEVIVSGASDHAVKVWNAKAPGSTRCKPGQFLPADGALARLDRINGWVTSLAFSPDGRHLAGTSRDRTVRIWEVTPGAPQWPVVALWYDKSATNFVSIDWAADGHSLVTGDRSGRIAVWDFDPTRDRWSDAAIAAYAKVSWESQPTWFNKNAAALAKIPRWSEGGHKAVWRVRFSPDGARVAGASADGLLSVYDTGTGAVAFRSGAPKVTAFHGMDWHPEGKWIAVGAADDTIYLFDASTGALAGAMQGHADVVTAVAWSPDGRMLASTAGGPLLSQSTHSLVTGPDTAIRLWAWK
jgi:WD40 repeat protein